jgi:hypothetical protein
MKLLSALLLVVPFFALACGASPTSVSTDDINSARQALEQNESASVVAPSVDAVETEEAAPLALVAADAGAPALETVPEVLVGDAGAAVAPEAPAPEVLVGDAGAAVAPEAPAPMCTENETRRSAPPNEQYRETCMSGEWTFCLASNCPFSIYMDVAQTDGQ